MRVFKLFVFLAAVFSFSLGLFWIINKDKKLVLTSPILGVSKIKLAENLWFPKDSPKKFDNASEISAKAAFFVETNTGEVLYEKNPKEKLSVASLVKIMTVIIALENKSLNDTFKVSEHAAAMEPDKMLLIPNEKFTLEELLYGIFLISANDAAEVLAEGVTGSRDEFVYLMNQQAKLLGMNDTFIINPTGLEEDNYIQLSTAFDVALMSRFAIKNWPKLVEISSTDHIFLPQTQNHQDYDMYSGINLLTTYPGVVGFKTGYTPEAGLTLVTLVRKEGKEILGVILGATNRRDDAKALLDYSFKKLKSK